MYIWSPESPECNVQHSLFIRKYPIITFSFYYYDHLLNSHNNKEDKCNICHTVSICIRKLVQLFNLDQITVTGSKIKGHFSAYILLSWFCRSSTPQVWQRYTSASFCYSLEFVLVLVIKISIPCCHSHASAYGISSKNGAGKMNLDPNLSSCPTIRCKCIKDFNLRF